jgi:hypothetical protein
MIQVRPLIVLAAIGFPLAVHAQFDQPIYASTSTPRAWIVVSDGVGPSGGSVAGTTGFSQFMRASAALVIHRNLGAEAGVLRIQEVVPAAKVVNDRVQNDPRADGVFVSLAQFSREGSGRLPALGSIGGAVLRRPTNTAGVTRLTSGITGGIESQLADPFRSRLDMTAGVRAILMPGGNHRQLYVLALQMGLRLH